VTESDKPSAPGKPFVPDKPIASGARAGDRTVYQAGERSNDKSDGKPDHDPRKITYRVGWKSGTIHMQDKGKATRPAPSGGTLSDFAPGGPPKPAPHGATHPATTASSESESEPLPRIARLLLRPAPLPTAGAWSYIVSVVPAAAFVALVWLAYRMTST
jgi:hypothetical protein